MKFFTISFWGVVCLCLALLAGAQDNGDIEVVTKTFPRLKALCVLQFGTVRGAIVLEQPPDGGNTTLEGILTELEPSSLHRLTIHEGVIDKEVGCSGAGDIFNPDMTEVPTGMVGMVQADQNGISRVKISSNIVQLLPEAVTNVVDRTMMVSLVSVDTEADEEDGVAEEPAPLGCCSIVRLG